MRKEPPLTYCIFSAQYRPRVGGVENYTHHLAEKMAERGQRAIIVTSAAAGLPKKETLPSGVEVLRLASLQGGGGRLPFVLKNSETRGALRWLAVQKIDRVIVQTRLYALSLLGARFAAENGIPCLVIEHGSAYTKTGFAPVDAALGLYVRGMRRRVCSACPRVYAVSQSAAAALSAQGVAVQGLLHNSVPVQAIARAVQNPVRNFKKEYGVPDGTLVVTYTGRLVREKGVLPLAAAVRDYNRQNGTPPLTLFLAGEGPLEEELRAQAGQHLVVTGRLPFEEVMALLAQSDMFCLPTSLCEGFPTSVLEAGAAGVFVLATAKGGVLEIVEKEGQGLLLPDNREETLLAALKSAAADEGMRKMAAKALQKRVETLYSYDALYKALAEVDWGERGRA